MRLSQLAEMAKIDDAITLYKQNVIDNGMASRDFIQLLVTKLGMTKAGATTYAYNARKKWEALGGTGNQPATVTPVAAPSQPKAAPSQPKIPRAPATPKAQPVAAPQNNPKEWLKTHDIKDYTIDANGIVNVAGSIHMFNLEDHQLPFKFGKVDGDFLCSAGKLDTLAGMPDSVGGDYFIDHGHFSSLVGSPSMVGESVACDGNPNIASLEGITSHLGGHLYLSKLDSLKSLQNIHKHVRQMKGTIKLENTPIESHILGVLMIKGCEKIEGLKETKLQEIINKHLAGERDVYLCQDELIDAGYAAFARL